MATRLIRSTALVLGFTLLAKLLGFVRVVVVAGYFGTSREMDAFIVAATIFGMALAWLDKPIRVVVVPLVTRARAEQGESAVWQQTSALLNGAFGLFLIIAVAESSLAPLLVGLVAPGLGPQATTLTAHLMQFLALALVLEGLARFLSAVSHAQQRFARPGLGTALNTLVTVVGVVVL